MKYHNLFKKINYFYKLAAAPEFLKLRSPSDRERLGGKLWFGPNIAQLNNDINNFAVFDNQIVQAIKNLENEFGLVGSSDLNEINSYYLSHPKTQELIDFICNSYNNSFPGKNAYAVKENLENDGSLDPSSGAVYNPIFILIHDLIHQIIESDFVEQLKSQQEGEVITLMDDISEDIASTLSGFQPKMQTAGQGLVSYLNKVFNENVKETNKKLSDLTLEEMEDVINKTFHRAKAELRGKSLKFEEQYSEEYKQKMKTPTAQMKQLVDGILSKLKFRALETCRDRLYDESGTLIDSDIFKTSYRLGPKSIWQILGTQDIFDEYNSKLLESSILPQSDSSALRDWMIKCLSEMKKVLNYFKYELEEEITSENSDEFEEDE